MLDVRAEAKVVVDEYISGNEEHYTPMAFFAARGDLPMCHWLFKNGAVRVDSLISLYFC